MSDTKKLKFGFNTAITGIDKSTGAWNEKAHDNAVKPLRGLVMQTDGLVGCYISRYGMEVSFLTDVTDAPMVVEAVQAAVGEVSGKPGFFPLRGDKTPTAIYEEPAKPNYDNNWRVSRVTFDTDLFVDTDEESTNKIVEELTARLVNADGMRQSGVGQRKLFIMFDERQTSRAAAEMHLKSTVAWIMAERSAKGYFPFVNADAEPVCTYETFISSHLISY